MAQKARVHAIDALARFRPTLVNFVDECRTALVSAEADAGRTAMRIRSVHAPYWKKEIRVRQEDLKRAKSELIMKQAMRDPDEARSTVEEKKAVDKARRRMREAEEKAKACQHWARQLEKEQVKFQGQVSALKRVLDYEMPKAIAELDRMALALEEYTKLGGTKPVGRARRESKDGEGA